MPHCYCATAMDLVLLSLVGLHSTWRPERWAPSALAARVLDTFTKKESHQLDSTETAQGQVKSTVEPDLLVMTIPMLIHFIYWLICFIFGYLHLISGSFA